MEPYASQNIDIYWQFTDFFSLFPAARVSQTYLIYTVYYQNDTCIYAIIYQRSWSALSNQTLKPSYAVHTRTYQTDSEEHTAAAENYGPTHWNTYGRCQKVPWFWWKTATLTVLTSVATTGTPGWTLCHFLRGWHFAGLLHLRSSSVGRGRHLNFSILFMLWLKRGCPSLIQRLLAPVMIITHWQYIWKRFLWFALAHFHISCLSDQWALAYIDKETPGRCVMANLGDFFLSIGIDVKH